MVFLLFISNVFQPNSFNFWCICIEAQTALATPTPTGVQCFSEHTALAGMFFTERLRCVAYLFNTAIGDGTYRVIYERNAGWHSSVPL